jgi:hypothetical protein
MTRTNRTSREIFTSALRAIADLCGDALTKLDSFTGREALMAHGEIEQMGVGQKASTFFRHFVPLRKNIVVLLADTYRRYFKLALAHASETGSDPDKWARTQLQPPVRVALEWISDWYILACDGENRRVRLLGSIEAVPGQTVSLPIPTTVPPFPPPTSWRAPAWLFKVAPAFFGFGPLKEQHVPAIDSEEKLGEAHTRLLLKGARRAFLWELGAAVETVRNEETAAAGAIRVEAPSGKTRGPNKRKGWQQRVKLHGVIRRILSANPDLQGMEFCAELDKRHALPLLDWSERGEWRDGFTWKEAWGNPQLRSRIRRVRQEAQKSS